MSTQDPNPAVLKAIAQNVAKDLNISFDRCHAKLLELVQNGVIVTAMSGGSAMNILKTQIRAEQAIVAANEFMKNRESRK